VLPEREVFVRSRTPIVLMNDHLRFGRIGVGLMRVPTHITRANNGGRYAHGCKQSSSKRRTGKCLDQCHCVFLRNPVPRSKPGLLGSSSAVPAIGNCPELTHGARSDGSPARASALIHRGSWRDTWFLTGFEPSTRKPLVRRLPSPTRRSYSL